MDSASNILVLSAGRRVELVQEFQRALHGHFPGASVFTTDLKPKYSAACQVSDGSFSAPPAISSEYVDFVLGLCKSQGIGMVVPTIDTELLVLSQNRRLFAESNIHVIISEPGFVSACRDKRLTAEVFARLEMDQPKIYDKNSIEYPCFCKPYNGSRSIGARIIRTRDELTPKLLADGKYLFMELMGDEYSEYTIDAYYTDKGQLGCLVPRERIEVRDGEVSKGATRKNRVYHLLVERFRQLGGARGCVTIQVFFNRQNNAVKASEINARFGGGYPLAHAAGADYPDWLIREYFLEQEIRFTDKWQEGLIMLRYDAKVLVHDDH